MGGKRVLLKNLKMMTKTAKWFLVILVFFALIAIGIFFSYLTQKEIYNVKIGYLPITVSLPLFVALENGYFDDVDLNVTPIKFSNSNLIMESLVGESLDATSGVAYSTLLALESQQAGNFKVYSGSRETEKNFVNFLIVKNDSAVKKISDLKGKKIIIRTGIANKIYVSLILKEFNLTLDDIQLQQVDPSLIVQTFNSPAVDAVLDVEPAMTIILEEGLGRVLIENPRVKYVLNPFHNAGTVFSAKFLNEQPTNAKKIIAATNKAIDFIEENPQEAKLIMAKYLLLDKRIASKSNIYDFEKISEIDINDVQKLADIAYEKGEIIKKINVSHIFLTELEFK